MREALVLRETRADTLQEDLAVARAAITQSTDQQEALTRSADILRSQLADAQAQEEDARRKLEDLNISSTVCALPRASPSRWAM